MVKGKTPDDFWYGTPEYKENITGTKDDPFYYIGDVAYKMAMMSLDIYTNNKKEQIPKVIINLGDDDDGKVFNLLGTFWWYYQVKSS